METRTNLRVLKRSRTPPKRGDIFVMQLSDGSYLFGRAILTDAPQEHAPMPGANLLYIYNARARTPNPHYAVLRPGRLLIPPVWTNRLAWTNGYFQTAENRPLERGQAWPSLPAGCEDANPCYVQRFEIAPCTLAADNRGIYLRRARITLP